MSEAKHTLKLPLHTEKWEDDILETKFFYARQVYNRMLDYMFKKRREYVKSDMFKKAKEIDDDEDREDAFIEAQKEIGFLVDKCNGEIDATLKNELFSGFDAEKHLSASVIRCIAGRAVDAVRDWHSGKRGKPYHKSGRKLSDDIKSIESAGNIIIDVDNWEFIVTGSRSSKRLKLSIDPKEKDTKRVQYSLSHLSKYPKCTIKREKVNGEIRYFGCAVSSAPAPVAKTVSPGTGVVGIDIGVSMIACVSENKAFLKSICDPDRLKKSWRKKEKIDYDIDRKRRMNNPNAFDKEGQYIKGEDITRSNRHKQLRNKRDDIERKEADERKRQHYELINELLEMGNVFIIEDNNYEGWQKGLFGEQIRDFAPGLFVKRLESKAKSIGGKVEKLSTYKTKLSSRCHCGRKSKKDLSERIHKCECGVVAQRDLYSAFLARNYDYDKGELDVEQCREDWERVEQLLREASSECQRVSGVGSSNADSSIRREANITTPSVHPLSAVEASAVTTCCGGSAS